MTQPNPRALLEEYGNDHEGNDSAAPRVFEAPRAFAALRAVLDACDDHIIGLISTDRITAAIIKQLDPDGTLAAARTQLPYGKPVGFTTDDEQPAQGWLAKMKEWVAR